jgi:cytochrome c oxidase subunit 3
MPTDPAPDPFDDGVPRQQSFRSAGTVGIILFLAALAVLFFSSLLAYALIRNRMAQVVEPERPGVVQVSQVRQMPWGTIELPSALWLSTALVIGVSVALWLATRQYRAGKYRAYRNSLTAAVVLAVGFLTVQAPAMVRLLGEHNSSLGRRGTQLYGLIFFLVLVHALHVVGGMVTLVYATGRAHRGGGVERVGGGDPIRYTTLYWHFLDAVWIIMFLVFYALR